MQRLQTPYIPISKYRLAAMGILLACVGALGVATVARAQTVTPRLGTPPFARDGLTRETAPTLSDAPDGQRPVGFEPQDSRGLERFHLVAAAAPSAGAGAGSGAAPADAQANAAELAKKLQNPIADLISVPLQNNWDFGIGPADAMRYTVNIQPVIPVSLTTEWNLIIRTIMPVIYAASPVPGGGSTAGRGTSRRASSSRRRSRPVAGGFGALARCSSIPPPPIVRWVRKNLAWDPRLLCSSRSTVGPMACWPTTSGRWRGMAAVTM